LPEFAQGEAGPDWVQIARQRALMHTAPGRQLSGEITQAAPTSTLCRVAQSQTVASLVATPVRPARNTQLNPPLAAVQAAPPAGLHDSAGGEQKLRPSASLTPPAVVGPVFVQWVFARQSESDRHIL